MTQKISVFGSANPLPGSPAYQVAYDLGNLLGQAGLTVLTGGYMGTMEAVSKGASEAGAHVIGVTSDDIEAFRPIGPNPWVAEEYRCTTLKERISRLIESCDAAIALPGGLGTLAEVSLTWNQIVIEAKTPKPLILIGAGWQHTMETFFSEFGDYVSIQHREYLTFAPTPEKALESLKAFHFIL